MRFNKLSTYPDQPQDCVLLSQDVASLAPVLPQASPFAVIQGCDPVRQGSSSAQLQGQSCWVPRGCSGREGFWNENSLFSGLAASQLPVRLRVSYNKRTATHSLEGKQEVREEARALDAQDHWGRDWILFFLEHRCVSNSCLRHATMVQGPSNSTTRPREEVLFWPQVLYLLCHPHRRQVLGVLSRSACSQYHCSSHVSQAEVSVAHYRLRAEVAIAFDNGVGCICCPPILHHQVAPVWKQGARPGAPGCSCECMQ